jgi:hypothetical protein
MTRGIKSLGTIVGSTRDASPSPDRKVRHDHIGQRTLQVAEKSWIVSVDSVTYQDSFDREFVDSAQWDFAIFDISKHSETEPNSAGHRNLTDIQ